MHMLGQSEPKAIMRNNIIALCVEKAITQKQEAPVTPVPISICSGKVQQTNKKSKGKPVASLDDLDEDEEERIEAAKAAKARLALLVESESESESEEEGEDRPLTKSAKKAAKQEAKKKRLIAAGMGYLYK
jgi:hypothetical protein